MNTDIITRINIDLRTEYYRPDDFAPAAKIAVLTYDSYMLLISMLTPEQRASLPAAGYTAIAGYIDTIS